MWGLDLLLDREVARSGISSLAEREKQVLTRLLRRDDAERHRGRIRHLEDAKAPLHLCRRRTPRCQHGPAARIHSGRQFQCAQQPSHGSPNVTDFVYRWTRSGWSFAAVTPWAPGTGLIDVSAQG